MVTSAPRSACTRTCSTTSRRTSPAVAGQAGSSCSTATSRTRRASRRFELDFQTVFNCAASVKHFADFDFLKRINVDGVRNLAELCLEKGARLVHVSTVSVCGDVVGNDAEMHTLTEAALELGQDTISNGYVHTKFLAERAILELVGEKGLDAKIMRVGNLMSRQLDGEFQVNFATNNFMSTLRSYVALGCFPVDEMDERTSSRPSTRSRAPSCCSRAPTASSPSSTPTTRTRWRWATSSWPCSSAAWPSTWWSPTTFEERLRAALADDAVNAYVSPLVNYNLDDDEIRYELESDNRFTVKALYRLGFQWSITETHYLEQAIQMMEMLGFFDLEGAPRAAMFQGRPGAAVGPKAACYLWCCRLASPPASCGVVGWGPPPWWRRPCGGPVWGGGLLSVSSRWGGGRSRRGGGGAGSVCALPSVGGASFLPPCSPPPPPPPRLGLLPFLPLRFLPPPPLVSPPFPFFPKGGGARPSPPFPGGSRAACPCPPPGPAGGGGGARGGGGGPPRGGGGGVKISSQARRTIAFMPWAFAAAGEDVVADDGRRASRFGSTVRPKGLQSWSPPLSSRRGTAG